MAQTKTKPRPAAKRSTGSRKQQTRSRGSAGKSRNSSGKPKSRSSPGKANGAARVEAARRAVEHTAKDAGKSAKDAGKSVGRAASKARLPLVAGGAALVGAAGGLAVGAHQARHGKLGKAMARRPQVKVSSRDVAKAAKEVGAFGAQMGHLASELQNARETANGGKHRSPIEVVLEGLTARRSSA